MSTRDDLLTLDAFLNEALELDADALEALEALADGLTPVAPAATTRSRLMASVAPAGRFARFAAALGKMIDVTAERAQALLDSVPTMSWEDGPVPNQTWTCWVAGGPACQGAIRGFFRMAPDTDFPEHTHLGEETILVLQGGYTHDDGTEARAGDFVVRPAGSTHSFRSHPGTELLYFVVIRDGIEIGGHQLLHRDGDDA